MPGSFTIVISSVLSANGANNMKANERAVTADFYSLMIREYPVLKTHPALARLFSYLNWGTWEDDLSRRLVLGSELIADMNGELKQWNSRNFNASVFLDGFASSTGINLKYSNWDSRTGRSRVLLDLPLPPHVRAAVDDEESNVSHADNLVNIADGTKFNAAKQRAWREEDRSAALDRMAEIGCPDAAALGDYLNHALPHRYSSLLPNLEAAVEVAHNLPNPGSIKHQLRVLKVIRQQPVPFYVPSSRGRTVICLNGSFRSLSYVVSAMLDGIKSRL